LIWLFFMVFSKVPAQGGNRRPGWRATRSGVGGHVWPELWVGPGQGNLRKSPKAVKNP